MERTSLRGVHGAAAARDVYFAAVMPVSHLVLRVLSFLTVLCLLLGLSGTGRASPAEDARADAARDGDLDVYDVPLGRGAAGGRSAPRGVLSRASSKAFVTLEGFVSPTAPRAAYGAAIVLGFAFDTVLRGSPPVERRSAIADGKAQDARGGAGTDRERPDRVVSVASAPPARIHLLPSPSAVRALVRAAWRAAGASVSDAEVDAIARRARASALLPETRLRGTRNDSGRLSFDGSGDEVRVSDSDGATVTVEARLTWRLDRIVYADDEPSLERLRQDRQELRMRLAHRAVELLFQRERARLDARLVPEGSREALDAEIRVFECESALDVLTDGWFSASSLGRGGT